MERLGSGLLRLRSTDDLLRFSSGDLLTLTIDFEYTEFSSPKTLLGFLPIPNFTRKSVKLPLALGVFGVVLVLSKLAPVKFLEPPDSGEFSASESRRS